MSIFYTNFIQDINFMINGKKIAVVLPAFNAAKTLSRTYYEIPLDIVDFVLLTNDRRVDNTLQIARKTCSGLIAHFKLVISGGISLYITGVTKRARRVEVTKPPIITQARGE